MTKLRPPCSFEQALTRIAGVLGWDAMGRIVGQAERTVRNWSDPDTTAGIGLVDARRLDAAYRAAGAEGYPLHDAYRLQLDLDEQERAHDTDALARATAIVAKEGGEAIAALVCASRPGATAAERLIAAREVGESVDALRNTLPMLDAAGASIASGDAPRGGTA